VVGKLASEQEYPAEVAKKSWKIVFWRLLPSFLCQNRDSNPLKSSVST
jgi:hypothetical protein